MPRRVLVLGYVRYWGDEWSPEAASARRDGARCNGPLGVKLDCTARGILDTYQFVGQTQQLMARVSKDVSVQVVNIVINVDQA